MNSIVIFEAGNQPVQVRVEGETVWLSQAQMAELIAKGDATDQIMAKRVGGEQALQLMNDHLAVHDWMAGGALSIADIALYAYTHVCEAGGFRLRDYPAVCAWLERIEAQPGYAAMD